MNKCLLSFLEKQKVLSVATISDLNSPWICNIYFGIDKSGAIYFVSIPKTKHIQDILQNENVSFATTWVNEKDMWDRKAIQGVGVCKSVTNVTEVIRGFKTLFKKFPGLKQWLSADKIKKNLIEERMYKIEPKYIKYWNDQEFGEDGVEEYKF